MSLCEAGRTPFVTNNVPGSPWSTPCPEEATVLVVAMCNCGEPSCDKGLQLCARHARRLAGLDAAMRAEKARLN